MIISPQHGPQYDMSDGTIGSLQLVRRWVLVTRMDGDLFDPRQGRYTYDLPAAIHRLKHIISEWSIGLKADIPATLTIAQYWCYPEHYDPIGPVPFVNTEQGGDLLRCLSWAILQLQGESGAGDNIWSDQPEYLRACALIEQLTGKAIR